MKIIKKSDIIRLTESTLKKLKEGNKLKPKSKVKGGDSDNYGKTVDLKPKPKTKGGDSDKYGKTVDLPMDESEELTKKQKEIDLNKNGEIDSDDLEKLRDNEKSKLDEDLRRFKSML